MSLYLKYRPQDFKNLHGQNFIKDSLQKSISDNKTVGAYLLCGPRGTGKTTTARLLAKTINCLDQKEGNPCLKCQICKDFLEDRLVDIIEIDAASHTGVDNIRSLIENAKFTPTLTKYKIYIIDEVHMLSKGAFNALLKTLEEPPSFVKFILATTETHKVPETIISRCQRYDFRRISFDDIKQRLLYIVKKEKIIIDEQSLKYIIENSGGGLRNAISLVEQLNINGEIKYSNIVENLGITPNDLYEKFLNQLLENDKSIIGTVEKIDSSGKNIKLFFKGLIFFIKDSILKDIKLSHSIKNKLRILDILNETYTKTKNSLDENTTFLIGILKIINIENLIPEKKQVLEKKIIIKEINKKKPIIEEKIKKEDIENIFAIKEENNEDYFDKNKFLELVKKAGGNSGLKMSLLGADITFLDNSCIIEFKTSFALKGSNTNNNLGFLANAISEMGYIGTQIILK